MEHIIYEVRSTKRNRTYSIRVENLIGVRFGRLEVLEFLGSNPRPKWVCRCSCGALTEVTSLNLKSGHTQSCGCLQKVGKATHGLALHPLYPVWRNMWERCTNPEAERYPTYGGRGVCVCDRWADIQLFISDMGERPPGYSIERRDRDGDYTPTNCVWADNVTQANNRSNNMHITVGEVTRTLAEWSRVTGVPSGTIRKRILSGWSPARAIRPVGESA